MKRSIQLVFVLAMAVAIAGVGSHLLVHWTKIKTTVSERLVYGTPNGMPPAFKSGSSLSDYSIDWNVIAAQTHTEILAWGVAGGSPYEFEQLQKKVPDARTTYVVVSVYDMDEANVSDFRAALVPLSDTINSLMAIHANWSDSKRAISQYPMTWLRTLFPTVGRSRAIMGRIHEKAAGLLHHSSNSPETTSGPILDVGTEKVADSYRLQNIAEWSKSELAGKLAAERASVEGNDGFSGQKFQALLNMLQYGCERGRTVVVVVPVSSSYSNGFITADLDQQFEAAISDAQDHCPKAQWLRLDKVPGLNSDSNFCDLVHMNVYGQKITTERFQTWLKQSSSQL